MRQKKNWGSSTRREPRTGLEDKDVPKRRHHACRVVTPCLEAPLPVVAEPVKSPSAKTEGLDHSSCMHSPTGSGERAVVCAEFTHSFFHLLPEISALKTP